MITSNKMTKTSKVRGVLMRLVSVAMVCFGLFSFVGEISEAQTLGSLVTQNSGRLKPFETFAQESLQLIYGKQKFEGKSAIEIVLTWHLAPSIWSEKQFIKISRHDVKSALRLSSEQMHFSPKEIFERQDRLMLLFQEVADLVKSKTKLNPFYQGVSQLQNQLSLYQGVVSGGVFRFVPPKEGEEWLAPEQWSSEIQSAFREIVSGFARSLSEKSVENSMEKVAPAESLEKAVLKFQALARAENPTAYDGAKHISAELHYNHFQPFMWAWVGYLIATLLLLVSLMWNFEKLYKWGWAFAILALVVHTYGFALRIYIAGRPPVSNMYESVIWVSWGATIFGMIFESMQRKKFVLMSSSLVGVLCLILGSLAPTVLDASIHPLQAALRSNMWLIIHVLTITLSYAAFFVSFFLGDLGLFYYLRGESDHSPAVQSISVSIYRTMQIGVVLLAAGTILGGIWADYSWGRFWGWDPKETWALIALLGYIAILHGRLAGWLRVFGFIASAVVCFALVIMAWYGVNFVLGAGLHSYGFGGGGIEYVTGFVLVHLVYVAITAAIRNSKIKANARV